jgi:hypothetical protein
MFFVSISISLQRKKIVIESDIDTKKSVNSLIDTFEHISPRIITLYIIISYQLPLVNILTKMRADLNNCGLKLFPLYDIFSPFITERLSLPESEKCWKHIDLAIDIDIAGKTEKSID